MRHRQNERELGEFTRLKLEKSQINPPPRAKAHRADVRNHHGDQAKIVAQYVTNDQRDNV